MTTFCKLSDLKTESDVEQKFISPLLQNRPPVGLGFSTSDFHTKPNIKKILIDKGEREKLYYPDYVVVLNGLPLMVIEAKNINEDLHDAYREARLYSSEINGRFSHDINPCMRIIVTNGQELWCGYIDEKEPSIRLNFENINPTDQQYDRFLGLASRDALLIEADESLKKIRGGSVFKKPTRLIGGQYVEREEMGVNSFGATLALELRHLFNPSTEEDRRNIVTNAYVESRSRQRHVDPIFKIIRAAKPPSVTDTHEIKNTAEPREIIEKLRDARQLKHELMLLVGSGGSGKSTFVDYLREVALPPDVKATTTWVSIDLNEAPLSRDEIYSWLKSELIAKLKRVYPAYDFDEIETLKKLFSVELNQVKKGPGAIYDKGSREYKDLLVGELLALQKDLDATSNAMVRYLCAERDRVLIITLDNCDKRTRDDQLLMFDVAKWLQKEFACLVFLPLRDVTYDHHRKEPPLDTAIKDLIYGIEPPQLMSVIYERVRYALRELEESGKEVLFYKLPNGMTVEYPRSDQAMYLTCILSSLFQSDSYYGRLLAGIAGRDIRKALEIFLDFCKSGHISGSEIFKIRQSEGRHPLPRHLIIRILIRKNRRFYNDAASDIKNLFYSDPHDTIPDPFVRLSLLRWLKTNYRKKGPRGIPGYFQVSNIISELVPHGHDDRRIRSELVALMRAGCIISESLHAEVIGDDDLVSIAPAGHLHLDLLKNINYLAACAEDTWFRNQEIANEVAKRISGKLGGGHYTLNTTIENANLLVGYLVGYIKDIPAKPDMYLNCSDLLFREDLEQCSQYVCDSIKRKSADIDYVSIKNAYPPGTIVSGHVVAIQDIGVFVEFDLNAVGLIRTRELERVIGDSGKVHEAIELGASVSVEIVDFNEEHKKFNLNVYDDLSSSAGEFRGHDT